MANTLPFNTAKPVESWMIQDGLYTPLDDLYQVVRDNKALHKSFDFSNVGLTSGYNNGNKNLRQFHQTRIFISDFGSMLSHGNRNGNTSNTYLLSANLPESFTYNVGSSWSQPLGIFGGNSQTNMLMQTLGDEFSSIVPNANAADFKSGTNRLTTLQVWDKSEPLKLSLKIPVLDDGHSSAATQTGVNTNLVEALEFLGSLALPQESGKLGFYAPPPSPLTGSIKVWKNKTLDLSATYAHIVVQIGGILLIDRCIIEKITVEYPNTKTMIRHNYYQGQVGDYGNDYLTPLLAIVTINLSTVEALTANTYSRMLWLNSQQGQGNIADIDLYGTMKSVAGKVSNAVKELVNFDDNDA